MPAHIDAAQQPFPEMAPFTLTAASVEGRGSTFTIRLPPTEPPR
jgi:hypothetical protein